MTRVSIAALVAAARGRRLVCFPTDTVPALAARPEAGELIFASKQRQTSKPLILLGATPEALWPFVQGSPQEWQVWQQVTQHYWPGALTLVLPASDRVPPQVNPTPTKTIGLRVPNWAITQTILQQTGPLATTSTNLSGQPPLQTLEEIERQFPEVLTPLPASWILPKPVLVSGTTTATTGTPSTVAKWTGQGWQILRQGSVQVNI